MLYLTQLRLDPRSRQVQRELRDAYQMHRTLLRAFGDDGEHQAARLLFRLEAETADGCPRVLAQSLVSPNWSPLQSLDSYLLRPPASKQVEPAFRPGQHLAFRLRANPTVKRDGKRLGLLKEEEQLAWLKRKSEASGSGMLSARVAPEGMVKSKRGKGGTEMTHLAVRFDGVLQVADPDLFLQTIESGIGPAKAFGFGLLSVARLP